ncbi:hypothetical protein LEP1GSC059_3201 [Leptospira noguchii serovar Panama str. CZ214]|uniref:Uncharacterized protein n=1 Tax=Leptospira noguchii serovar Panama str. CZ214 TaxID=1001595 RepID=T0GSP8_9LEPT|nr:hypothetical protein LEP1GSC059_2356 [Leptospira noguchii serovar Panama str. CZ214]EQA70416.1 hypothetical protein LEP1GSC059_0706 [Leptospira noguchii serovar Panama str. CZ214]EQA72396.1 hypothetical protein LEP1GSC059_3671 [Leptospira noguchii serovar Panama str. CZ214]EQA72540.1 hypothetical protein LEP1GSC059_3201 [Leptospira noguchii serovar Panama str. CZ214]
MFLYHLVNSVPNFAGLFLRDWNSRNAKQRSITSYNPSARREVHTFILFVNERIRFVPRPRIDHLNVLFDLGFEFFSRSEIPILIFELVEQDSEIGNIQPNNRLKEIAIRTCLFRIGLNTVEDYRVYLFGKTGNLISPKFGIL